MNEQKWLQEFEEWWANYLFLYKHDVHTSYERLCAKLAWFESRRKFIAQLKKDAKFAGFDVEEWEENEVEG